MRKSSKKSAKKAAKKALSATRRIGLLHSGSKANFVAPVAALRYALLPLNVELVEKYAADLPGDVESNLDYLAEGLVQDSTGGTNRLEAIVAAGGPTPALLLQRLTKPLNPKPPIVFTTVVDPDGLGLVDTEAKPKWNLTGMAGQTSELDPERLHMLFELAKDINISKGDKVGVLVSTSRPDKDNQVTKIKNKADGPNLKLKLRRRDVKNLQEIENAFVGFKNEPVKGVVVTADSLFNDLRADVVRLANASGLPTIYQWKEFVELGGLISFGPDIVEAYGMAGEYVKRILNGESPSTMACSRPSRFKVYVNRATAQQLLGITTIPTTLLGHPVQVI
jgi:putative ABC transport system substrate-binding protein